MKNQERFLYQLIQALQLAAADAETQIGLLPQWVHIPDEITLIFGESYSLFDQIIDAGLVTHQQATSVHKLNSMFSFMSDLKDIWTFQAMRTHPEWEGARVLARSALIALGYDLAEPDLGWMIYVPGQLPPNSE